jgi:phosphoribosylformimino-5-aminoimidazole carboxamide ribotide isomerase
MILYPAIDILDGACVRLHKGNFDDVSYYSDNPLEMAKIFKSKGATWLHVVDLSGAKNANNRQFDIIESIATNTNLNIQTGGGLRSYDDVKNLLSIGVQRVVIGSLAIRDPELIKKLLIDYGQDRIVLALDVIDEKIAISGWRESTNINLYDIIDNYLPYGLKYILCTDIARDGTMMGPNIDLYKKIAELYSEISVQASGGIGSLSDLKELRKNNIAGTIVGKALYENLFTLEQALEVCAC